MKKTYISKNVIRRLPRYLRKLDELIADNIERISSGELGPLMGLTPSQIRQDFSCFGKCSITVALPVLSSMGISCSVVPTSVLSTHTGGFGKPEIIHLTQAAEGMWQHWQR